jgi:hypothetical protein
MKNDQPAGRVPFFHGAGMRRIDRIVLPVLVVTLLGAGVFAATISVELSGEGAVDEKTIRAGQPVSVDIYFENDQPRAGMTVGFRLHSGNISEVVHVSSPGEGLNDSGDVKGHNGFGDASVWDLFGLFAVERSWDGYLPDTIGFGGVCNEKEYAPHEREKKLSFEIMVPEPGAIVIDSSYFPPSGVWMFSSPPNTIPPERPEWKGPYKFQVIE